jgi:hypothetical protein
MERLPQYSLGLSEQFSLLEGRRSFGVGELGYELKRDKKGYRIAI